MPSYAQTPRLVNQSPAAPARIVWPRGARAAESVQASTAGATLWPRLPYRSVEVQLPDGSFFRLAAECVARQAARTLSRGKVRDCSDADTHLVEQILPALLDRPELLLEFAAQLPWADAQALARHAHWRSSPMALEAAFRGQAVMSLSACQAA